MTVVIDDADITIAGSVVMVTVEVAVIVVVIVVVVILVVVGTKKGM